MEDRHHCRDLRQPERRRVLAARRLHADLLVDAPAALQRALAGVQGAGDRRDRLPLGQRPLRDGGLGADQEAANVFLLADGNGQFTEKMGLLVDKSDLNFGKRSWRYSMLVRNGRIEKQFIEPNEPGDPFKVSDADTMLAYVNPGAKKPDQVAILTRDGCSFCAKAKRALTEAGYDYVELPLPHTIRSRAIGAIAGAGTVPQVFINGRLIGGAEDLERWAKKAA